MPDPTSSAPHPHKQRTGLRRLWHATGYSLTGLRAGWEEKAFRQEVCLAALLLPSSFYVGRDWMQTAVLAAVVVLVLITELLNSGIEAAIDRVGHELHPLSKRAKDLGSAAVLLSLLLCAAVWAAALYQRYLHG
ncbi:diacylglycerol kinase [Diaphorobacter nitroreducens]|uniref:diacylglycerol kinase n=1 Tax=Diaphorobacter nitroreducens TaxID=164759 RepID=UPI0028AC68EC|nr:diacylglycerol kinase [Diaphorobacter nitroreducens]